MSFRVFRVALKRASFSSLALLPLLPSPAFAAVGGRSEAVTSPGRLPDWPAGRAICSAWTIAAGVRCHVDA